MAGSLKIDRVWIVDAPARKFRDAFCTRDSSGGVYIVRTREEAQKYRDDPGPALGWVENSPKVTVTECLLVPVETAKETP